MTHSMTGFGKAVCELPKKKINIEIKSLNSKQLDINTRLPGIYREKELEIRNITGQQLIRGKIDLVMFVEKLEDEDVSVINQEVVKSYYQQLKKIAGELKSDKEEQLLPIIMRLPETLKVDKKELGEEEWRTVKSGITDALDDLIRFRATEGKALEKDMIIHGNNILLLLEEVRKFEDPRIKKIEDRIRENLKGKVGPDDLDQNRLEQEMIYYLEKLDISEEKIRLKNHCEYFLDTLNLKEPVGKKLGFITQEMGREINTLGSKANDSDIQKIVVRMKDELEKMKEQVLNVL